MWFELKDHKEPRGICLVTSWKGLSKGRAFVHREVHDRKVPRILLLSHQKCVTVPLHVEALSFFYVYTAPVFRLFLFVYL